MNKIGVVFDFNGTLFWDTHLHNKAWDIFLNQHDIILSDEKKLSILHGKNNELIIKELLGSRLTQGQAVQLIHEKESIYQEMCLSQKLKLAPGVVPFLNYLRKRKIPFTIATASGKRNVDFYFEYLNLERWFNINLITFNDGTIKSKPDPQIYSVAIEKLGILLSETIIFEDSIAGIQSAQNVGAGKVIIVNSTGFDYSSFSHEVITDFNMVDKKMFDGL